MPTSLSMRQLGERMDPVHPVLRLRGSAKTPKVSWYKGDNTTKLRNALRTYGGDVGLYHQREKGLSQVHRERFSYPSSVSLRRFVDRHQEAKTVRMLVYNTWLINPPLGPWDPPERTPRSKSLARRLESSDYDIIALCEVFEDEDVERFRRHLSHMDSRTGPHGRVINSGLITFLNLGKFGDINGQAFSQRGHGFQPEAYATKGILYTEIDLGLPGGIDLFSTHLHATNPTVRNHQIRQLATFIAYNQKPKNVTILVGDFNVDGRSGQYEYLLRKLNEPFKGVYRHQTGESLQRGTEITVDLNLEDIWLSRGGPSGSTHEIYNFEVVCKLGTPSEPGAPYYCDDEYVYEGDHTSTDDVPGYRLDYVFIQKPAPEHLINVDVSRVRRNPFWRTPGDPSVADPKVFKSYSANLNEAQYNSSPNRMSPHFLSDHIGLDLTLYVTDI